jgi:hypothetical protein
LRFAYRMSSEVGMSKEKLFNRKLDELYQARTYDLRREIAREKESAIPPPRFDKRMRNSTIKELRALATRVLRKRLFLQAIQRFDVKKRQWHIEGDGTERRTKLRAWLKHRVPAHRGKVYVFWEDPSRCLYVGRTLGRRRPAHHSKRDWFARARRIDVYYTRNKSAVPSLECLAIHRFDPSENKVKAAKQKGARKCQLCQVTRKIRKELRHIFQLRRG